MGKSLKQAYRQAPWRLQLQAIGLSMLPVVFLALLGIIYLIISAQAAGAGLEIMGLHADEEEILRVSANYRTQLAWLTTFNQMQTRAEKLGFVPVDPNEAIYIKVPGYTGRPVHLLAPPPGNTGTRASQLNQQYQQSLWDWFYSAFLNPTSQSSEGGI